MFALDQTIDPIRGFFLPFSERKKTPKTAFQGVYRVAANALAAEPTEKRLLSGWIPGPVLNLLIHLVVSAILFSVLAGISLGFLYVLTQFDITAPFVKVIISVALVCDLGLLLLSVTKSVIKTLRDV